MRILDFYKILEEYPQLIQMQTLYADVRQPGMMTLGVIEEIDERVPIDFVTLLCIDRSGGLYVCARYTYINGLISEYVQKVDHDYIFYYTKNGLKFGDEINEILFRLEYERSLFYIPKYVGFFTHFGTYVRAVYNRMYNWVFNHKPRTVVSRGPQIFGTRD